MAGYLILIAAGAFCSIKRFISQLNELIKI